jgi:riboflavin kinase / FMN adenylyltransferase
VTRITDSLDDVEPGRRAVALGTFDGVHLGHRRVVRAAVEHAPALDARSMAATFHPRPVSVLVPDRAPDAICSLTERITKLGDAGAEEVLVIPFTTDLASLTPEAFVDEVLVGRLGAVEVCVGQNFRFGHGRSGDPNRLRMLGEERGFGVTVAPLLLVNGEPVSSSRIRDLIRRGDVTTARALLGAPPMLDGTVIRGDGRGRELGVPTANITPPADRVLPAEGVYAGEVLVGERRYRGAISVGTNPTFDGGRAVRVEAHLLRFDQDLYGVAIQVEFHRFLRPQRTYTNVDELVRQMHEDIAACDH